MGSPHPVQRASKKARDGLFRPKGNLGVCDAGSAIIGGNSERYNIAEVKEAAMAAEVRLVD